MNRPRVSQLGEIELESVNALSHSDLSAWIRDRLQGRDLSIPSDPQNEQMPHYLLSLIYPKLSRQVREDVQSIVLGFGLDIAKRRDESWQGEAADELFMLLNSIVPSFSNKEGALDLLLEIAEGDSFSATATPDLRLRALQGIITLRHRTDTDFWLSQLRRGGERYYPVFLEGLSIVGLSALFKALETTKWTEQLSDAVLATLPTLLEDYGPGKVAAAIEKSLPKLPAEARQTLTEFLAEEDLVPTGEFPSPRASFLPTRYFETAERAVKHALLVDLQPGVETARSYLPVLSGLGLATAIASNANEVLTQIDRSPVDIVVTDVVLPDMNGLDIVKQIRELHPEIPVIVLSAYADVEPLLRTKLLNSAEVLIKPFQTRELRERIEQLIGTRGFEPQQDFLPDQLTTDLILGEYLLGTSAPMKAVFDAIVTASFSASPVLILGETGTGKDLVAQSIHSGGLRHDHVFIKVNLSAIPSTLIESELFGFVAGAFAGAKTNKLGRMAVAHGGTLFLDEIGELPDEVQAKLVRALQEHEIRPLGSTSPLASDVRIIAATNRDLSKAVRAGHFRQDLYSLLAGFSITVPPLRERKDDIPLLVSAFIKRLSRVKEMWGVSDSGMADLMSYDWPGNVRELQNVIERAVILASSSVISHFDLPWNSRTSQREFSPGSSSSLLEMERRLIIRTLELTQGDRLAAARALGLQSKELMRKMKILGLES